MRAIDLKLLRDLKAMRGQAVAIGFVIVAGVSAFVAMTSISHTLTNTLETYYTEFRFADGFGSVRRAPEHVAERLELVSGISTVQTRVAAGVNLEVEGFNEPGSGTICSLAREGETALNRLFSREGRIVSPGREDEVWLNVVFAESHGLRPDDEIGAIINGRRRTLRVVGIALSHEFLMQVQPGGLFPDAERYGGMWMGRDALAAAYDMQAAFKEIAFTIPTDAPT